MTSHQHAVTALLDASTEEVQEFIGVCQQVGDTTLISQGIHYLHQLVSALLRTDPDTSTAISMYRAMASTLTGIGEWEEKYADARLNAYKELVNDYNRVLFPDLMRDNYKQSFPLRVMTPYELSRLHSTEMDAASSPLAVAAFHKLCPAKASITVELAHEVALMAKAQGQHQNAVLMTNKSTRKTDRAVVDNHQLLAHLVEHKLVEAHTALMVSSLWEQRYMNQLLFLPDTTAGQARIVELLVHIMVTNHYQYFNDHALKELVDDPENTHLPVSLMFTMSVVNQGRILLTNPNALKSTAPDDIRLNFAPHDVWKD